MTLRRKIMFWAMGVLLLATILVYAVLFGLRQLPDWKMMGYSMGASLVIGVALIIAMQWLLQRLAVAPIRRLSEQLARLVREGNLTRPVAVSGHGEIQALVRGINDMRAGLDQAGGCDITERKRAEEKLQASLFEKELLLEEIHHRVKNNMQIISSLLNLQADFIKDPRDLELFRESQNRIRSMALVHESLYQSDSLARVNFGNYFNQLVADLYESYGMTISDISLRIDIDPSIQLSMETAVPCGLIVNELISNALKHAFPASVPTLPATTAPERRRGEIRVSLKPDGADHLVLVVADTGNGLPPDFDVRQLKTLGLKLVTTLAAQIQGTAAFESRGGAICRVRFPTYTI